MPEKASDVILTAILVLVISAILLSGFGGLAVDERIRTLCGLGAGFCLFMLLVCWMFVSGNASASSGRETVIAAVFGAVGGVCYSLYFDPEHGWAGLIGTVVLGAVMGVVSYWGHRLRHMSWRD